MNTTFKQFSAGTLPLREKIATRPKKPRVIVLAGPTCVGKTKHSLLLARLMGGEIISADSMQVYRGLDIGTAKATALERAQVPHHLIDIRDLIQNFNVADFYEEAMRVIHAVLAKGHVPIVVGGTGFYIHSLIYGPPQGPPSVPEVRQKLEDEMREKGSTILYDRLKELDPDYAMQITHSDRHKIVRALEIISLTSRKVSEFPKMQERQEQIDFRCWFLYLPKEILYSYIEMRCDEMIAAGLIEEVRQMQDKGLRQNTSSAQAIGYRQCLEFLDSAQTPDDFDAFVTAFKQASRRYAKRQFTWFRKEPLFRWLNIENLSVDQAVALIIQDYET